MPASMPNNLDGKNELAPALRDLYNKVMERNGGSRLSAPLIGLTCHTTEYGNSVNSAYVEAIEQAGGIPVLLPTLHNNRQHEQLIRRIDAILFTGGGDMHSQFMGEELSPNVHNIDIWRDRYELELFHFAYQHNLPMLGICRGFQVINVALGGTLMQDIYSEFVPSLLPNVALTSPINHSPNMDKQEGAHTITFTENGTFLAHVLGLNEEDCLEVNSIHHQAVREVASELTCSAISADGICEAAIGYPNKPILCVQWHPEHQAKGGSETMKRLFRFFVAEADAFQRARTLHRRHLFLDSHTDTPMVFEGKIDFTTETRVSPIKLRQGEISATIFAAYIPQGERDDLHLQQAYQKTMRTLQEIRTCCQCYGSELSFATSVREVLKAREEGRIAILPAIENGYAMGRRVEALQEFRQLGIVYMTLCHNGDNDLCDSALKSKGEHGGLSSLGRTVIAEMNKLGIIIDISHTADSTIEAVLQLSKKPIVASHSSCRALCAHPRNLTDEQIRAIAERGGVVQICLYNDFLVEEGREATLNDAYQHLQHIIRLVGVAHAGIGSDFDGGGGINGLQGSNDLINLTRMLVADGYCDEEISAIMGGNFLRVMEQNGRA